MNFVIEQKKKRLKNLIEGIAYYYDQDIFIS